MIQKLGPVYEGKRVFIDWKSGIGPAIYKQFQLPSGERLVHESPNPVFMPNYPGKNINICECTMPSTRKLLYEGYVVFKTLLMQFMIL